MRASQLISARLESVVRAEGHHRQASKRWDSFNASSPPDSRKSAACCELQELSESQSAWLLLLYCASTLGQHVLAQCRR